MAPRPVFTEICTSPTCTGAPITSGPQRSSATFTFRNPVMLFKGDYAPSLGGRNYDVSPDGKRFLMLKVGASAAAQAPPARFTVVENWFEELKRLAPAK